MYPGKCVTIISWFHMWFSRSHNIRSKYQAIYQTKLFYYFTNEFEDSYYLILIEITNEQYDDWNILEFICMKQHQKPISKNTHNFRLNIDSYVVKYQQVTFLYFIYNKVYIFLYFKYFRSRFFIWNEKYYKQMLWIVSVVKKNRIDTRWIRLQDL